MPLHHRQGDLLLVRLDTRPAVPLTVRQSDVIVAGEATVHAHRLQAGTILEAPDGTLYLDVTYTAQVIHEEQGPITLDPGRWLVVRQREYTPEAIWTVAD